MVVYAKVPPMAGGTNTNIIILPVNFFLERDTVSKSYFNGCF
jgi:hypothetical protein